jgi:hypothetical protein
MEHRSEALGDSSFVCTGRVSAVPSRPRATILQQQWCHFDVWPANYRMMIATWSVSERGTLDSVTQRHFIPPC